MIISNDFARVCCTCVCCTCVCCTCVCCMRVCCTCVCVVRVCVLHVYVLHVCVWRVQTIVTFVLFVADNMFRVVVNRPHCEAGTRPEPNICFWRPMKTRPCLVLYLAKSFLKISEESRTWLVFSMQFHLAFISSPLSHSQKACETNPSNVMNKKIFTLSIIEQILYADPKSPRNILTSFKPETWTGLQAAALTCVASERGKMNKNSKKNRKQRKRAQRARFFFFIFLSRTASREQSTNTLCSAN